MATRSSGLECWVLLNAKSQLSIGLWFGSKEAADKYISKHKNTITHNSLQPKRIYSHAN